MTPDDNGPMWYHLSFGATKGAPADEMGWAVLAVSANIFQPVQNLMSERLKRNLLTVSESSKGSGTWLFKCSFSA